jgi:hypothetical protein
MALSRLPFENFRDSKIVRLEYKVCRISLIAARMYLPSYECVVSLLTAVVFLIIPPFGCVTSVDACG